MKQMKKIICIGCISLFVFSQGCMVIFQKGRRSDMERIQLLEQELEELRNAKDILERSFAKEISDKDISIALTEKGLVITMLDRVLFDSGKADLKSATSPVLDKVANLLQNEVAAYNAGVEGHTDNQPIKHSKWKSNWELSAHRALSVVDYLISKGVAPERLSANGHGEYKPVFENTNDENRQKNRRVEIVIMPKLVKKSDVANPGQGEDSGEEVLK